MAAMSDAGGGPSPLEMEDQMGQGPSFGEGPAPASIEATSPGGPPASGASEEALPPEDHPPAAGSLLSAGGQSPSQILPVSRVVGDVDVVMADAPAAPSAPTPHGLAAVLAQNLPTEQELKGKDWSTDPETEALLKEGRTLLMSGFDRHTSAPGWWSQLAKTAETLAPLALGIGLAVVQPELLALLPEVAPEVGAELATSIEMASPWASLRLEDMAGPSAGSTTTLADLVNELRSQTEKPSLVRSETGDRRTADKLSEAKEAERDKALASYMQKLSNWAHTRGLSLGSALHKAELSKADRMDNYGLDMPQEGEGVFENTPRGAQVARHAHELGYRHQQDGIWVKTGDHSIETTGVTSELLIEDATTSAGPPQFFSTYGVTLRNDGTRFQHIEDAGTQVGSNLALASPTGGVDVPHMIWGTILCTHEAPIAIGDPRVRFDLHVHNDEPVELGRFTQSSIANLFQAGMPSERFVFSALQPNIQAVNTDVVRRATTDILLNWEFYDNSQIYAKLLFYGMLRDYFTFIDVVPVANAFGQEAVITWVNLADAALAVDSISDAIRSGHVIMRETRDIFNNANDLQLMYWLAKQGMRMDGPAGAETPHQCYVEWGPTQIIIFAYRAQPAAPAAAILNSTQFYGLATRLATERSEWSAFTRGLYMAAELMGTRLIGHNGTWHPLRPSLSPHSIQIPAASDYSILLRYLNVFPPDSEPARIEGNAFIGMSVTERIRAIALYNAVITVATTTALYDINVTAGLLNQWCVGAADIPAHFTQAMTQALNEPEVIAARHLEPVGLSQPRKAFKLWLGVGVEDNIYVLDRWLGTYGQEAAAGAHVYVNMVQNVTPTLVNPMIIDNWLDVRPIEWGIVGDRPIVNFQREIVVTGAVARRGWRGEMGSIKYSERATSQEPYKMVVYGAQAINVITQLLRRDAAHVPIISHQDCEWQPNRVEGPGAPAPVEWDAPVAYPAADQPYTAIINSFQPCTIMSYDYATQTIRAPCLVNAALGALELDALVYIRGQVLQNVGVVMRNLGIRGAPLRLMPVMNFRGLGGVRGRRADPDIPGAAPVFPAADAALGNGAAVNPH